MSLNSIGRTMEIVNQYALRKPAGASETAVKFAPKFLSAYRDTEKAIYSTPFRETQPEAAHKLPEAVKIISGQQLRLAQIKTEETLTNLSNQQEFNNWLRSLGAEIYSVKPGMFLDTFV